MKIFNEEIIKATNHVIKIRNVRKREIHSKYHIIIKPGNEYKIEFQYQQIVTVVVYDR